MIILEITGLIFLGIIVLLNLSNPAADKIKYYLSQPFKSITFFDTVHNKIESIDFSGATNLLAICVAYIKKLAVLIYRFENEYLHHFLQNIDDFISLIGLIFRKFHDANIKVCTVYILVFIVLFYFIFRVM